MNILNIALILIAAGVVVAVLVRWFEKQIVFFPSRYPEGYWEPRALGLPVEDIFLTSGDLQLHGWYVPHPRAAGQILMCHGNAGNVTDRLELLQMLHAHVPANVFIFDYRGFGRSNGSPSENGVYEDAVAAFDWLKNADPELPIIVHGHSLGSAVAIDLATKRKAVAGLILESPFTNAKDMARRMFGGLPMHWFASMRWASDEKIATLHLPKLFLHGGKDLTIPLRLGEKLYQSAASPKEFVTIPNGDHNNLYLADSGTYFGSINRFMETCVEKIAATTHTNPQEP